MYWAKGFQRLMRMAKRWLPEQRDHQDLDTVGDADDDTESWLGLMSTSTTEDWKRIQEGQRMLQLSTSLWCAN